MKNINIIALLSVILLIAALSSVSASPLAEIRSLSKTQQEYLYGILDDKEKADKQLLEAQSNIINTLEALTDTQKALTEAKLEEAKLRAYADDWKARSEWFEKDGVKSKAQAQKAISQTNKFRVVVWIGVSVIALLSTVLVIRIFGPKIQLMGAYGLLIPAGTFVGVFVALAGAIEIFTRI